MYNIKQKGLLFLSLALIGRSIFALTPEQLKSKIEDEMYTHLKPGVVGQTDPQKAKKIKEQIEKRTPKLVKRAELDKNLTDSQQEAIARLYARKEAIKIKKEELKRRVEKNQPSLRSQASNFNDWQIMLSVWSYTVEKEALKTLRVRTEAHAALKIPVYEISDKDINEAIWNEMEWQAGKTLNRSAPAPKPVVKSVFKTSQTGNNIYPEFGGNLDRNRTFYAAANMNKVKERRESECPICMDSFDDKATADRATLYCTHSLCGNCLAQLVHLSDKSNSACPICRTEISKAEFSPEHLKKYFINYEKMLSECSTQEQRKVLAAKLRDIFEYSK